MQCHLSFDQRLALRRAVADIEKDAHKALKIAKARVGFDVAGYWNFLIATSEFQFCILGTQRINYSSLFFAYEDFLANSIRTKEPGYSSKKPPIKIAFANHFGDPLTKFCSDHEEVVLAKLVRHALVHNGGRFGKDLNDDYAARFVDVTGAPKAQLRGDQFNVVRGKIQITPCNTAHLFHILKDRVTKIVETLA